MHTSKLLFVATLFCANSIAAQEPLPIAATHGYVYAQLPRGLQFRSSPSILQLADTSTTSKHDLQVRPISTGVASVGQWLPAGEYRLAEWEGARLGEYPTVSVKAGHLTDLGQLIAVPVGGYDIVVLPLRNAEAVDARTALLAEIGPSLSASKVIEWHAPELPKPIEQLGWFKDDHSSGLIVGLLNNYHRNKDRPPLIKEVRAAESVAQLLKLAKSAVRPLTEEPATDAQSNLYYGAELGQVRMRKPSGEWSALDTGSLRTVTAVEVLGTTLVAGLDSGAIRISKDAGATWTKAAALSPDEAVVDIDRVGTRWVVATRRLHEPNKHGFPSSMNQVKVYVAAQDDFADIASIKTIDTGPANWRNYNTVRASAFGGHYYLNPAPELMRLDIKSMKWDALTPPDGVTHFHVSPSTEMLTAFKAGGIFSKLHVSADRGANWTKTPTPANGVIDVYFENADEARAIRGEASGRKIQFSFVQYNRAGKHWAMTAMAPLECAAMLSDAAHVPKFCITKSGSILSHDKGNWAVEFANE